MGMRRGIEVGRKQGLADLTWRHVEGQQVIGMMIACSFR